MSIYSHCNSIEEETKEHGHGASGWHTLYHHSWQGGVLTLKTSVEQDCFFCRPFWEPLSNSHHQVIANPAFTAIIVAIFWNQSEGHYTKIQFVLGPEFDACEEEFVDSFELLVGQESSMLSEHSTITSDMLSFRVHAIEWMNRCSSFHGITCTSSKKQAWLPRRLIDVGQEGCIRIVPTELLQAMECPYIALSFRFDEEVCFGLDSSNLENRNILLAGLPLFFRHAIIATSLLGFRYLWIDIICIFQDSEGDRLQKYIAQTGLVYQNCSLHIAATGAETILQGLFPPRTGVSTYPLDLFNGIGSARTVAVEEKFVDHWSNTNETWSVCRFLPGSTGCTKDLVLWETPGIPDQLFRAFFDTKTLIEATDSLYQDIDRLSKVTQAQNNKAALCGLHDHWKLIVKDYSRSFLPNEDTRLIGVQCLAQGLGDMASVKYAAGLWREDLLDSLLWYIDGPFNTGMQRAYRPDV
ncbi:hypothetical protein EJ04DRAFT_565035 [Polyplosphaeria fusca]|uniref:Heterokaryon incompatibility domain-containing protein n=1 Tax=Polyplosphaeria fusca TaxID=682080 RepID=A0A9P4V1S0_9PLEO|nr:hypothetical protein EJ04DRAFT_565035 [Polyplosphaeria fusca]